MPSDHHAQPDQARITDAVTGRHNHTPKLLQRPGNGPDSAAALLNTAGDNPDRIRSEASSAALCGVSPIEASSGKTRRRRLNRSGDRRADAALYHIALTRTRCNKRTRDYLDRRTTQGMTRHEATLCVKRYIARKNGSVMTLVSVRKLGWVDGHKAMKHGV